MILHNTGPGLRGAQAADAGGLPPRAAAPTLNSKAFLPLALSFLSLAFLPTFSFSLTSSFLATFSCKP